MANVYGRVAKISNAVGRSNYINDEEQKKKIDTPVMGCYI